MKVEARPLRNTQQRRLVLELVRESLSHPTADELYTLAREKDPTISKGTVYRNLKLLAKLGEIRKLAMPIGPDHYDFNTTGHYHFICRRCNKVVDANVPFNETLNGATAQLPGYKTERHELLLVGLCPECSKESSRK